MPNSPKMTRGKFNFQIVQDRNPPLQLAGLGYTGQVKLRQRDNIIFLDADKIDELIDTLRACKKWLMSK